MEEECSDLKTAANAAGDSHYRAMAAWIKRGRTTALRERAYALAVVYRRSLDWLIGCYRRLRHTTRTKQKLDDAVEFKSLVEKDIEILDRYRAVPDSSSAD